MFPEACSSTNILTCGFLTKPSLASFFLNHILRFFSREPCEMYVVNQR